MDVSADLKELGRTPVMVVSAGVKSILDIGRTLEYLVRLRSVYAKCDFNPICCRSKFYLIVDVSSSWKYIPLISNPNNFVFYLLFCKAPYLTFVSRMPRKMT